jgi:hypothetical protein
MDKHKKTLVLHIGTHKTGTTSIQFNFQKNSDYLSKHGLYYPKHSPNNHSVSFLPLFLDKADTYFHFKSYYKIRSKDSLSERLNELEKFWKNQFEAFSKSDHDCFIISGENFCNLPDLKGVEKIKEFTEPYFDEYKIIIYIREAISYIRSDVIERVKNGFYSLDEFDYMVKKRFHYKQILNKYQKVFGEDNIIVRVFEKDMLINGDINDDFLYAIGYSNLKIAEECKVYLNESLGKYSAILLSERNSKNKKNTKEESAKHHYGNRNILPIFNKITEPNFNIDINISKKQIDRINEETNFINKYIEQGFEFEPLIYNGKKNQFPGVESLPNSYIINLVNESAKHILDIKYNTLLELHRDGKNRRYIRIRDMLRSFFIKRHVLFNKKYYMETYKDVKKHPFKHFILKGAYEGRNPNPNFNTLDYIMENPDIVYMAENPIFHYSKKYKR